MKNQSRQTSTKGARYRSPSRSIARNVIQVRKERTQAEFGKPTAKGSRPRRFGSGQTAR